MGARHLLSTIELNLVFGFIDFFLLNFYVMYSLKYKLIISNFDTKIQIYYYYFIFKVSELTYTYQCPTTISVVEYLF